MNEGSGELLAFNPEKETLSIKTTFPRNDKLSLKIYHYQKRDEKSVWVCSNHGLFIIDWDGNIIAKFNDNKSGKFYLPANDIHHLHQKNKHEIWVATGDAGRKTLVCTAHRVQA